MASQEKISFTKFINRFNNEEECQEYLFQQKWPHGFVCLRCGAIECYKVKKGRGLYQCKHCRHQTSLTANTVMHRTHLPLTTWFWAIYLIATDKRGISVVNIEEKLVISYESAWYLLKRIRKAMKNRDDHYMLSGIVEFDDAYFCAYSGTGKRGRGTDRGSVLVALSKSDDNKPKYLKMQVVPNIQGETIGNFAKINIEKNSVIQSDAYRSYRKPFSKDYEHQYKVFDSDSDMLKWLHTVIGNAKAFINGTFHGIDTDYLQDYLDEFCYRFNRRHFKSELFPRLVCAVANFNMLCPAV